MAALDRISFEFFPPKSADAETKLAAVRDRLDAARPDFYSVTYGAGGSTRDRTLETVLEIREEGRNVAPHLSMGSDEDGTVHDLVDRYRDAGVDRIVALRGDVPSGMGGRRSVHFAVELVELLRRHAGDHFTIDVACYPEVHPDARSPESDLEHFRQKVEAGADEAITQYFYNADAYFDFLERATAAGVRVPIIPGIMPITNVEGLMRFSAACGAEIPRWIRLRLEQYQDDRESVHAFGLDVVSDLCRRLQDGGAPGFHFYTMNQSKASLELLRRLGHGLD